MSTVFTTGISTDDEAASAGRAAIDDALAALPDDSPEFCQVFCSSTYDHEAVLSAIRSRLDPETALIGCVSTGEFTDETTADRAVALGCVAGDGLTVTTGLGVGLQESVTGAVREATADLPIGDSDAPYQSAIVLHDGLSGLGEQLSLAVQRKLGPTVAVAGGAASDNYDLSSTPVFCEETVAEDAVAVAFVESDRRLSVAVDHGHEPISDPMTATDTDGSVVYTLDGRPAFDAWADAVEDHARERLGVDIRDLDPDAETLARIMGEFEFGIDQGEQYKMRWPRIADAETGALQFAVDIPEGTVFRVMHGAPDDQIDSAGRVVRSAVDGLDGAPAGGFVYDCSCREIILGDSFDEAVDTMREALGAPFCGFETYGETCLRMGEMSGFHNTTTVVMLFPE